MFTLRNLIAITLLITTTQISAQELKPAVNAKEAQIKENFVTVEPTTVKKEVLVKPSATAGQKEVVLKPEAETKKEVANQETTKQETTKAVTTETVTTDAVAVSSGATVLTQDAMNDLEVVEFVLANSVQAKEPKDVVETFGLDAERGFAFARLNVKAPSEVTFLWYRNGNLVNRFSTQVHPSKTWRTFSSVKMRSGEWKVQLLQKDKVLAEKTFTIE